MTEQEKRQLVEAVITQLKNEGTDVSSASVVEDVNGVSYVLCYDTNGNIVRVSPDTINQQESTNKDAIEANATAIANETQRATEAEESLRTEANTNAANLAETKKDIANQLFADSTADKVTLTGRNQQSMRINFSADIPAATTEKAGVMTAGDKKKVNASIKDIVVNPNVDDVELDLEDNTEKTSHVVFPAATAERAGVMSAEDKKELQDINSRVGNNEETITLMSSDLLPMTWNGTKMVSSTNYNIWIVPLSEGREYKSVSLSFLNTRRTCSEYPVLGKELSMVYAPNSFKATSEMKYFVVTVDMKIYDGSDYEISASEFGLMKDFNDIEPRVTIVEKTCKEVVQLKRDMHSRFGSNDRTVVLTSSDYDNIVWDGTKFSLPGSVEFNGFVVPIYPGERIIYQVDRYANHLRTTTEYPVVGSSDFVRKGSELNGYFTVQENEHYLFINCYTPAFTSYKVIVGEGAISDRFISTFERIISTFETSATRDSVGIVGKNSAEEIIFESKIPSATTEKAGVMSAEDKKELQDINSRVGSQSGTIILTSTEYNNFIWDGTKFVASNTTYNGFVIPITSGQRVVYNAKWANNACTLQNYPTIGSSERVRTRTELNGDFIAQDNERYLFLNTDVELHTSYTVTFSSSGLTSKVEALTEVQLPLYGKTIICFGDSLTEFNGDDGKGYADYLAELTQANIIRGGVGGTQLATRKAVVETIPDTDIAYQHAYGAVDISNLVKAWANNDWGIVDNAVAWLAENRNDDNSAVIERLKANPIENTDIVIVFGGSNDCANGTFGSPNDTNPLQNTCGGINQIIDSILSVKPNMTIYFFTPIPRMVNDIWCDDYRTDQSDAHGSLSFPSLVKRIKECVEYNHIPCCDMYNTIGINRKNIYTYADDGVHPNHGYSILANKIYGFILANRIWK